jgi:glycerophosphoryl diester phosphodiesterase
MMNRKLVIGHRGARSIEKENTIKSFQKAIELKVDMIELDLRKTLDNYIIIFHDDIFKRKKIENTNYQELNSIAKEKGFEIPTLEDVLKNFSKKTKFDFHVKELDYFDSAIKIILKYIDYNDFILTNHDLASLIKLKEKYPKIRLGLVIYNGYSFNTLRKLFLSRFYPDKLIKVTKEIDFIIPDSIFLSNKLLNNCKTRNLKVIPWTINSKREINKLFKEDSIFGLITDKPDLAVSIGKSI